MSDTPKPNEVTRRITDQIIAYRRWEKERYPEGIGAYWAKAMRRHSICLPTEPPNDEVIEAFTRPDDTVLHRWTKGVDSWFMQDADGSWTWPEIVELAMTQGLSLRAKVADEEQATA